MQRLQPVRQFDPANLLLLSYAALAPVLQMLILFNSVSGHYNEALEEYAKSHCPQEKAFSFPVLGLSPERPTFWISFLTYFLASTLASIVMLECVVDNRLQTNAQVGTLKAKLNAMYMLAKRRYYELVSMAIFMLTSVLPAISYCFNGQDDGLLFGEKKQLIKCGEQNRYFEPLLPGFLFDSWTAWPLSLVSTLYLPCLSLTFLYMLRPYCSAKIEHDGVMYYLRGEHPAQASTYQFSDDGEGAVFLHTPEPDPALCGALQWLEDGQVRQVWPMLDLELGHEAVDAQASAEWRALVAEANRVANLRGIPIGVRGEGPYFIQGRCDGRALLLREYNDGGELVVTYELQRNAVTARFDWQVRYPDHGAGIPLAPGR